MLKIGEAEPKMLLPAV